MPELLKKKMYTNNKVCEIVQFCYTTAVLILYRQQAKWSSVHKNVNEVKEDVSNHVKKIKMMHMSDPYIYSRELSDNGVA